jgi:hypothetical protein
METPMTILSRRKLIATALALAAAGHGRGVSGQSVNAGVAGLMAKLASLTWDRRRAEQIWNQAGGPRFEIIDYVDMRFLGKVHRQPVVPAVASPEEQKARGIKLTYEQIADIREALSAISLYLRGLGMAPPKLPMADGKFYVFVCGDMADIAGAAGDARGVGMNDFGGETPFTTVPEGTHLILSSLGYFDPYKDHPFSTKITIAHELVHAIDRYMVVSDDKPGVLDGVGKWWSEGNVDSAPQYSLKALGYEPEKTLRKGARSHAKNIGARPFDYPLTLKGVPPRRPAWVREGLPPPVAPLTEADYARGFWTDNAPYFTSSFWRFLMKEEAPARKGRGGTVPGDFELFPKLRGVVISSTDVAKAAANREWMDTGVSALDGFLREQHPTWGATGLYRAFPAFIAHFIEWPDQVIKSRQGILAHEKWLAALFMEGAPKKPISIDKDIAVELTVLPLAAKAIRFEIPQIGIGPDDYPPVTITVSILDGDGQANPIDNIHVGLRGQCLANGVSQPGRYSGGRVRRWASVRATPLKRSTVKDETILSFINVAPDPTTTRPVRIRVQVSLQAASTTGQCSYHPKPVDKPDGGTVAPPPSKAPSAPEATPVVPITIDAEEIRIVLNKNADLVRMLNDTLDINTSSAIDRENEEGSSRLQGSAASVMGAISGGEVRPGVGIGNFDPALVAAAKMRALEITLTIPSVKPGYVGSVSGGRVTAEWHEPAYAPFAEYGVSTSVRIETDVVQVQITSSGDGAILGTFSADFDRGSENTEAIFRGRIEGRFSLGIANDAVAEGHALPEDPSACMPTDFFITSARNGMKTAEMAEFFRQLAAEMGAGLSSGGGGGAGSGGGGGQGGAGGQAGVLEPGGCKVTPAEFDAWFEDLYGSHPMITPAQRAEMKQQFLSTWDYTEQLICASRNVS